MYNCKNGYTCILRYIEQHVVARKSSTQLNPSLTARNDSISQGK